MCNFYAHFSDYQIKDFYLMIIASCLIDLYVKFLVTENIRFMQLSSRVFFFEFFLFFELILVSFCLFSDN